MRKIFFADDTYRDIREFCTEFGHENYWISADCHPTTRFAQWISLYRKDRHQICTPEETNFFQNLAPHLMQALAMNRLIHLDRLLGDSVREKWSVAITDPRGHYLFAEQRFRDLQAMDWPSSTASCLPPSLLNVFLQGTPLVAGTNAVIKFNLDHGLLYLRARERVPADSLSSRETLVAKLLIAGQSQKEIAKHLDRSPETIRTQVRSIFEKLNINSVASLATYLSMDD